MHRPASVQPPPKVRTSLIVGTIIAVASLLVLGAVVFRHPPKPIITNTSRLGLNVEREGPVLLVAWDRKSQAVHNATHAILHIKDGRQQSQTDLNRQQLGVANVKYWPETQKVTFMLEVYQAEGSISESVQITGEPAPVTATAPKRSLEANASLEADRPSPFALHTRREISLAMPAPLPRLMVTAAATPPPSVAVQPDQESRLGRMLGKIPFLRRLKKHPQHPENEYPLR